MTGDLLHVSDLSFSRPGAGAESGFALEVETLTLAPAQALGVVGPSGCGKSTLIDLLALLRRPARAGRFDLMGHDVARIWSDGGPDACAALRAKHVGVVLQTGGLLPSLPVWENVTLSQALLGQADDEWASELLRALELTPFGRRLPSELSIGQRQRVAIARALAHRPALVLADEPTAALGREHARAAMDLLLGLTREAGAALLIASHDVVLLRAHGVPLLECVSSGNLTRIEPTCLTSPRSVSVS
jgi:putative ABC transport system ATP-binding protein